MAVQPDVSARFWRRNARRYDRAVGVLNRRFPEVVRMVEEDVRHSRKVLEVAAGTGLVTVGLASLPIELTATDASAAMLDVLRGRLFDAGHRGVRVAVADVRQLAFPDASFDALVAANLLHLLADVPAALAELGRVLRPGGVLCVPTFGHGEHLAAQVISRALALMRFPVVTRFRSGTLRSAVETAGFEVIRACTVPGLLPLLHLSARRRDAASAEGIGRASAALGR